MSEFKIGQMLKCIDATFCTKIKLGEIYPVARVDMHNNVWVLVNGYEQLYCNSRFEPHGPAEATTEEHTGGSSSYYTVEITTPTTPFAPFYKAECNDIIEALELTFAEANVFKAIWRTAAARQGREKKGNDAVYDAEKCVFFSGRILVKAEQEAV